MNGRHIPFFMSHHHIADLRQLSIVDSPLIFILASESNILSLEVSYLIKSLRGLAMQPHKLRSKRILAGREDLKALEYALYHSMGYTQEELGRALVAVVNSWSEILPGHYHLRGVGEAVKSGIRAGGGTPIEFNTIGLCDGIAQGHIGMKYVLPSLSLIHI